MSASLLYKESNKFAEGISKNSEELIADLNLSNIMQSMSQGDPFLLDVAKQELLAGSKPGIADINYRQANLKDALDNKDSVRSIYEILDRSINQYHIYFKKSLPAFSSFVTVSSRVKDSIELFSILVSGVQSLIDITGNCAGSFKSPGFTEVFSGFRQFFSEDYIAASKEQVFKLKSTLADSCICYSASMGPGLKGTDYLLKGIQFKENGKARFAGVDKDRFGLSSIGIQAQAGALRDAGLLKMVYVLNEVNKKTLEYLERLRYETGFYLGCIHLHGALLGMGVPIVFPEAKRNGGFQFENLVDAGMAFSNNECPVGNTLDLQDKNLIIVTGANQGGKSTFLRSIGCAQLMMQCGLFVAAKQYSAGVCSNVYTHFCRQDSGAGGQGKLDEELFRMNRIIDWMDRGSLVLLNESFSSAPGREASGIAGEITKAFYETGIRMIYVTHLYDFTNQMADKGLDGVGFLAAGRNDDGSRPYTLEHSMPLQTSFGLDIYNEVFGQ